MSSIGTATTVASFFHTESAAEKAVNHLQEAGFQPNQIGVAYRASDLSGVSPSTSTSHAATSSPSHESTWDKLKSFFSSETVEPYADERAHGDLASHEITTSHDYTSGYSDDDFDQSLSGLSIPVEQSRYFRHRFEAANEGAVVTVTAAGREEEAVRILTANGGDVGDSAAGYDYPESTVAPKGQQRIQLLGEVLRVYKDRVSRGEVRLRKEVITETQMVEGPVTREELVIERTLPVDAHTATGRVGENTEIRIPLTEEVASVSKDTVVREEVTVGKRAVQSVASVGDSISHEALVVEDQTDAGLTKRSA